MKKITFGLFFILLSVGVQAKEIIIVKRALVDSLVIFSNDSGDLQSQIKKSYGQDIRYSKIDGVPRESVSPIDTTDNKYFNQQIIVISEKEVRFIHSANGITIDKVVPAKLSFSGNNSIKTISVEKDSLAEVNKAIIEHQNNKLLAAAGIPENYPGHRKHIAEYESMNCIAYASEMYCSFRELSGFEYAYKN